MWVAEAWRRDGWLDASSDGDLPLLVVRPDGMGRESIDNWAAVLRFGDTRQLLKTHPDYR